MIHLDANYLILATVAGSVEDGNIRGWLAQREVLAASAMAWMEFTTCPVIPEVVMALSQVIDGRILPVRREETELAAQLFNATGRKRAMRYDTLIAATAILAGARMATNNRADYMPFVPHGLRLA